MDGSRDVAAGSPWGRRALTSAVAVIAAVACHSSLLGSDVNLQIVGQGTVVLTSQGRTAGCQAGNPTDNNPCRLASTDPIHYEVQPAQGWRFAGFRELDPSKDTWAGPGNPTSVDCDTVPTGAVTSGELGGVRCYLFATFVAQFQLSASIAGDGTVDLHPGGAPGTLTCPPACDVVTGASSITLQATPGPGSTFTSYTNTSPDLGAGSPCGSLKLGETRTSSPFTVIYPPSPAHDVCDVKVTFSPSPPDGGADAGPDAAPEAGPDAAPDAPAEAGPPLLVVATDTTWLLDGSGADALVSASCIPAAWAAPVSPAQWIWSAACTSSDTEAHTFTKTFTAPSTFASATLQIAVDNYANVRVNTTQLPCSAKCACNGAACTPGNADVLDVTAAVQPGTNVVTLDVHNVPIGAPPSSWLNPAGVMAVLTIR